MHDVLIALAMIGGCTAIIAIGPWLVEKYQSIPDKRDIEGWLHYKGYDYPIVIDTIEEMRDEGLL